MWWIEYDTYLEGVDDYWYGYSRFHNPYWEWSDSYILWDNGWLDAYYYGVW